MIKIHIITVGTLKEDYLILAKEEYVKRISRFAKLKITELKEETVFDEKNKSDIDAALLKEGQNILSKISQNSFAICLCIEGKMLSSIEFSKTLEMAALSGKSEITFIIGSSFGLCDEVKRRADLRLSFSKMTFPHQLARIILLEQLYRAFKISAGENYHK